MSDVLLTLPLMTRIPLASLPAGEPGKSNYDLWLEAGNTGTLQNFLDWLREGVGPPPAGDGSTVAKVVALSPGASTTSAAFVATGLQLTIDVPEGKKVLLDARALVAHNQQRMVHFTLRRASTQLHPSGSTGLGCVRVDYADSFGNMSFQHLDAPGAGEHTYELLWRQHHNDAPQGTAILGKRAADSAIMVPATLSALLVDE